MSVKRYRRRLGGGIAGLFLLGAMFWMMIPERARGGGNLETLNAAGTAILNRFWHQNALPVHWETALGSPSFSNANTPAASVLPALQGGFGAWQAIPTSFATMQFDGASAATDTGLDGINLITFVDSSILAGPDPGFVARAPSTALTAPLTVTDASDGIIGNGLGEITVLTVTFPFPVGSYPAGAIVDADIEFNTFGTNGNIFSTNGTAATTVDIQDVVTHEQGHFLGLSHSPIPAATMFPFVDQLPINDGGQGPSQLHQDDIASCSRYYPAPSFAITFGSIRGTVTLDGSAATAVHVVAVNAATLEPTVSRFSISQFLDPADVVEGGEAPGNYLIDGLPPGNYHVYVEYFDNSEFLSGRLNNAYNTSVANSTVATGSATPRGSLGFLPALAEFYNSTESGDGGDGVNPASGAENSDAAALVAVVAGVETAGINIAINIDPGPGPGRNNENPTARQTLSRDTAGVMDTLTGFLLNGGGNDFWVARYPAAEFPAPPFNLAEGLWGRAGLSTQNYPVFLAFPRAADPSLPDLANPIAFAGRVITGGPNGAVAVGDFADVRDQWNVTINTAQNLFIVIPQPDSAPGISFLVEGFFPMLWDDPTPSDNTLLTEDGGITFGTLSANDILYDLVIEEAPPVMVTGLVPGNVEQCGTGVNLTMTGAGFEAGALPDLGSGITVTSQTVDNSTQISLTADIDFSAALGDRTVGVWNPEVVFPNLSRLLTIDPFTPAGDCDNDGLANGLDCAPFDPGLIQSPLEVTGVAVTNPSGSAVIHWDDQGGIVGSSTNYDLISGSISILNSTRNFSQAICLAENVSSAGFLDLRILNPGEGEYYLLRAQNSCGSGTHGTGNAPENPRPLLDTSGPCL